MVLQCLFFLFQGAQTRSSLYLKCLAVVLGDVRRCGDECPLTPGLKQAPKLFSPKLQGGSEAWLLAEKSAKSVAGGDSQVQWVPCCLNSRAEQLVLKQEKAAEPNQTAPNFSLFSLRMRREKYFCIQTLLEPALWENLPDLRCARGAVPNPAGPCGWDVDLLHMSTGCQAQFLLNSEPLLVV